MTRISIEPTAVGLGLPQVEIGLPQTEAECQANAHWQANLHALGRMQPHLAEAVRPLEPQLEWVYGRDGALTGISTDGKWWGGCSLPGRVAQELLRDVEVTGTACLLSPTHATQVETLLSKLEPDQAVLAVVPDLETLAVLLYTGDLSRPILAQRLWFASTSQWADELRRILSEHPGLPIPVSFIKTKLLKEDDAAVLMQTVRRVFQQVEQRRGELLRELKTTSIPKRTNALRVCLLAPTRFRLWNDAAQVLGDLLMQSPQSGIEWHRLDPDQPCSSGELAIAHATRECQALVTANFTRAELASVVPDAVPIVTWLTGPRIPRFEPAMADDALLLADGRWKQQAMDAGWPSQQVSVARWPSLFAPDDVASPQGLGVIADTMDVTAPKRLEWSSQLPLWEFIANELRRDPFVLEDVAEYLVTRMKRLGTQEQGLDRRKFLSELILPAYQQGLVRLLVQAGVPAKLFGRGWSELPEFAPLAQGPVTTRQELAHAAGQCAALAHLWPVGHAHAIEALGRPVVRAFGRTRDAWLRDAARAAAGAGACTAAGEELSAERVAGILRTLPVYCQPIMHP